MPVKYTSRASFHSIIGDLSGLRLEVYEAIKAWPDNRPGPSIEDLANLLQRKESSMSGRVNELKQSQLIEEGPMKLNISRKPAMTYRALVYNKEQLEFAPIFKKSGQGELFGNPPADRLHN